MATTLDYSTIETNMKTVLSADSWLGSEDPVRVQVFEDGLRLDVEPDRYATFGHAKFPAVVALARTILGEQVRIDNDTFGEDMNFVPCAAFVIDQQSTILGAVTTVLPIAEQVERVVKAQRSASKNWNGSGHTYPGTVRSGLSIVPNGATWAVIAEILFDMQIFTEIDL